jgi:hypothetical protein
MQVSLLFLVFGLLTIDCSVAFADDADVDFSFAPRCRWEIQCNARACWCDVIYFLNFGLKDRTYCTWSQRRSQIGDHELRRARAGLVSSQTRNRCCCMKSNLRFGGSCGPSTAGSGW